MGRDGLADRLRAIFVSELEDQLRTLNQGLLAQEEDPASPSGLGALFRVVHTLKGAASAAHVEPIARVCHLLESRLARARDGKGDLEAEDFTLLFRAADFLADSAQRLRAGGELDLAEAMALEKWLAREVAVAPVSRPASVPPAAPPVAPSAAPSAEEPAGGTDAVADDTIVRVSAGKLDALVASSGQLRTASRRFAGSSAELQRLHDELEEVLAGWSRALARIGVGGAEGAGVTKQISEFKLLRDRVSRLVDGTGTMAVRIREDVRALERAAGEIGSSVHHVRLRPFSDACIRLPRAVRDLATATGREARVEIAGGGVEADRAVIDVLSEVLPHLVRNAVDHGLEAPSVREAMGKNRVGTIRVKASQRGARLAVSVSDDGAGIDLASIRARLATLGEPIPADPQELEAALFRPGFSTRRDVNPISGRGVGLDVVRTALQRIGGTVEMRWEEGKGTTFRISTPVSLSTLQVLLVEVDSQLFAIPTANVERIARVPSSEIHRLGGRPSLLGPDGPVQLVSLASVLGPPLRPGVAAEVIHAVSLQLEERRLAVRVDGLVAQEEIMVRPLRLRGRPPSTITGAAILPAGEVVLVLDAQAVLEAGARVGSDGIALVEVPGQEASRSRILVIDDSITTRTLEEGILRAAGFDVETAADGESGWRLLRERPFQLVVSDVEMPRMDGVELCRAIRADSRLAATPVVLVSGLESAEERARGLEAGADAYLPKSSFDQRDLLDTIHQLLG